MTTHNTKVVIIDNGAWQIKAGLIDSPKPSTLVPNCGVRTTGKNKVAKFLVADETEDLRQASVVYRRPHERGYLVDWGLEKRIWDRVLAEKLKVRTHSAELVCIVPPFQPRKMLDELCEIAFEELQFASLFAPRAASMIPYDPKMKLKGSGCIVVDAGYSHCHITPVYDRFPMNQATLRLNVGGKALTNSLKELISYRQWNMMDETWLVNHVKERLSYVSLDFLAEMQAVKHCGISEHACLKHFVLPDYVTSTTGWVKGEDDPPAAAVAAAGGGDGSAPAPAPPAEQVLKMGIERFCVPEYLFRPDDMGSRQMGLSEGIAHCIKMLPRPVSECVASNILVAGGCANIAGFHERIAKDVRCLLPEDYPVHVASVAQPEQSAWRGAAAFVKSKPDVYQSYCVKLEDYKEYGSAVCASKFTAL